MLTLAQKTMETEYTVCIHDMKIFLPGESE
jgi:hypothetical protein